MVRSDIFEIVNSLEMFTFSGVCWEKNYVNDLYTFDFVDVRRDGQVASPQTIEGLSSGVPIGRILFVVEVEIIKINITHKAESTNCYRRLSENLISTSKNIVYLFLFWFLVFTCQVIPPPSPPPSDVYGFFIKVTEKAETNLVQCVKPSSFSQR